MKNACQPVICKHSELLMQTTPGFEDLDSGADGILPECRSCRFHRPHWKYHPRVWQSVLTAAIPFQPSKIKVAHLLPERKSVMDNKIEVFKNEQFGEVRTILEGEHSCSAVQILRKHLDMPDPERQLLITARVS